MDDTWPRSSLRTLRWDQASQNRAIGSWEGGARGGYIGRQLRLGFGSIFLVVHGSVEQMIGSIPGPMCLNAPMSRILDLGQRHPDSELGYTKKTWGLGRLAAPQSDGR